MAETRQIVLVFPATGVTSRKQSVGLNNEFLTAAEISSVAVLTPTKDVQIVKLRTALGAEIKRLPGATDIAIVLSTGAGVLQYQALRESEAVFRSVPDVFEIEVSASDTTNPITLILTVTKRN